MIQDSYNSLDTILLPYEKIIILLKMLNKKTKNGKEITHKDLRQAVSIMQKKHFYCRWVYQKLRRTRNYILIEGCHWLREVYFQNKQKQIDADIAFFEMRIKQYEELLKLEHKTLWEKDLYVDELEQYFNRATGTIKNNIIKMNKATNGIYRYKRDGKYIISKEGIEWLCKNCFKQKYLELLEDYKMELTQKYMEAGYIYDNFFVKF